MLVENADGLVVIKRAASLLCSTLRQWAQISILKSLRSLRLIMIIIMEKKIWSIHVRNIVDINSKMK